jgi:hypothetical protein
MILLNILYLLTWVLPIDSSQHIYVDKNITINFEYDRYADFRKQYIKFKKIEKAISYYFSENIRGRNMRYMILVYTQGISSDFFPFLNARMHKMSLDWDILIIYKRPFCLNELLGLIDYSSKNFEHIREKQTRQSGESFGSNSKTVLALEPKDIQYILDSYKGNRNLKRYQKSKFCIE